MKQRLIRLQILLPGLALAIILFVPLREAVTRATAPALPRYALKGTVVSVESDDRLLLIEHEEIPDFMPPMTMYFRVDASTHRAARVGDHIEATMIRHPESLVLQNARLTPPRATAPMKS